LVILGALSGSEVFETNIGTMLRKQLRVGGWDLGAISKQELVTLFMELQTNVLPLSQKTLRPMVDRTFSWVEISDAHQYLEEGNNKGKVVAVIE